VNLIDPKKVYHCLNGDKAIDVRIFGHMTNPRVAFTQVNAETGMHYYWLADRFGRVARYPLLDLVES
jgi:hypothetical protein